MFGPKKFIILNSAKYLADLIFANVG